MAKIVIMNGDREGNEIPITPGSTIIGRVMDCDVVIPDSKVSRKHCQVINTGSRYFLEDRKSRHGTWLNGKYIESRVPLELGQNLIVGLTMMHFCEDDFVFDPAAAEDIDYEVRRSVKKFSSNQKKINTLKHEEKEAKQQKKAKLVQQSQKRITKELLVLKIVGIVCALVVAARFAFFGGFVTKILALLIIVAVVKIMRMTNKQQRT